ncbi:MAG: pyruvate kinase [Chlamydiae bacterium]|nr:pyruvate kinase [Chlamydiota bacterium]
MLKRRFRKTKIICTIGPSCNQREQILALAKAGMDVARLNFSHASHEEHAKVIEHLKSVREELGISLAIMLDTKGPEIRTQNVPPEGISVHPGLQVTISKNKANGITIDPELMIDHLQLGDAVLIDDGYIECHVVKKEFDNVVLEAQNFGVIKNRKGVNVPGRLLPFPEITDKDAEDIKFGCQHDIDIIAASFINTPEQLLAIKKLLRDQGCGDIQVIAKIESQAGVDHFDQILQSADGIMVARGDLGVEMPITSVPRIQKKIIKKCLEQAKPVIIATQMLESMIHCSRPTRAEVSDVANAIYDSASAVMLSAETAAGRYPVLTVKMMDEIIKDAEADTDKDLHIKSLGYTYYNIPSALAEAAVTTSKQASAKAIIVFSKNGNMARLISRSRPSLPIIVVTPKIKTFHQTALLWGAHPVIEKSLEIKANLDFLNSYLIQNGFAEYGDVVVITLGVPYGISHTTNTISVESIGNVVARGVSGRSKPTSKLIYGKRRILLESEIKNKQNYFDEILVLTELRREDCPYLEGAKALILQSSREDFLSERIAREYADKHDMPCIIRADSVCLLLADEEWITISEDRGLVFRGDAAKEKAMIEKVSLD